MALINQNRSYSARDFLFIVVGLLGAFAFFMTYGSQDPRGMIEQSLDQSSAVARATEMADALGYNSGDFRRQANFGTNRRLLDSLQYELGRQNTVTLFRKQQPKNVYPYFWEVHFQQKSPDGNQREISFGGDSENTHTGANEFILRLTPGGEWIELINGSDLMPEDHVNRKALRAVFGSDSTLDLSKTRPDSTWQESLRFNIDHGYNGETEVANNTLENPDGIHQYSRTQVLQLGDYHLRQSGWTPDLFEASNIRVETVESTVVVRIRYNSVEPIHGQRVSLQTSVVPTGSLIGLNASYNATSGNGNGLPSVWELVTIAGVFLFAVGPYSFFISVSVHG